MAKLAFIESCAGSGVKINSFRKGLYIRELEEVASDPMGRSFDLTLLCIKLRRAGRAIHGILNERDAMWKEGHTQLETIIKCFRDKRAQVQNCKGLSDQDLITEICQVRNIMSDILVESGRVYSISKADIDQQISDIGFNLKEVLNYDPTPEEIAEFRDTLALENQNNNARFERESNYVDCYNKSLDCRMTTGPLPDYEYPLGDLYTEIRLNCVCDAGQVTDISLEDIFEDGLSTAILIEGSAGVGKTTLLNKIVSDWQWQKSSINFLLSYDLLLKTDLRNSSIRTFDQLLQHLMPLTAKNVKNCNLKKVALAQTTLVILDGLNEINKSSHKLTEELLNLLKDFRITLLVATRPEKVDYFKEKVKALQIRMKHFRLLGIPMEKTSEFITKYFNEITNRHVVQKDLIGLLEHLKSTAFYLNDLWRVPYNVVLLTILWSHDPINTANVRSAPELYREMYGLYRVKILKRLDSYHSTRSKSNEERERIFLSFMEHFCRESLKSLKDDCTGMSQKSCLRIMANFHKIEFPTEEMIATILKKDSSSSGITYKFPHKVLHEFFAAIYIWHEVGDYCFFPLKMKLLMSDNFPRVSGEATFFWSANYMKLSNDDNVTRYILERVFGSSGYDLSKFQNVFIILLGMLYLVDVVEKRKLEQVKLEVLTLLKDSGIEDLTTWVEILQSVKCNENVASFIRKLIVMEGDIILTDSSLSAYMMLFKVKPPTPQEMCKIRFDMDMAVNFSGIREAFNFFSAHQVKVKRLCINDSNMSFYMVILKDPALCLKETHEIIIDIHTGRSIMELKELLLLLKQMDVKVGMLKVKERNILVEDDTFERVLPIMKSMPTLLKNAFKACITLRLTARRGDITDFLNEIIRNSLPVEIYLRNYFRFPLSDLTAEDAINQVFQRCEPEIYMGAVTTNMSFAKTLKEVFVSVANTASYRTLQSLLESLHHLEFLDVCVKCNLDPSVLTPLPKPKRELPCLYIVDVTTETEMDIAVQIIKNLMPDGQYGYSFICFPRWRVSPEAIFNFLKKMKGVKTAAVCFPEEYKPSSANDENLMNKFAKNELDWLIGIEWGTSSSIKLSAWENTVVPFAMPSSIP